MNWLSKLITTYPSVILVIVGVLCSLSSYFSFHNRKLPSFEDPQLGFETRGTEISQRIIAWDKLMEESKPYYGSLVINPSELSAKSSVKSRLKRTPFKEATTIISHELSTIDESREDRMKKNRDKKRWETLKELQFPVRTEDVIDEQYKQVYRLNYNADFFCDALQPGYAQFIFSAKPDNSMFSYNAIADLCNFQNLIESIPGYMRHCITSNSGDCCNMWSLPNYIAWIFKLPSCKNITPKEINSTLALLESCSKYYRDEKLSPRYKNKDVPRVCSQNQDVYSIMQFIVDVDFLPTKGKTNHLQDTSVYLPMVKNADSLKFFHDIEKLRFSSEYFTLTAMDLGVKYPLFDEYLVHDTRYIFLSTIFILVCVWLYTGCVFITFLTITAIFFSLINAYFVYTFVFGLNFFPFMNILAVIVSLGIGSDDAYIICKVWDRTKKENSHLSKLDLVRLVIKHSAVAVFVTTLTTVAAFLSSYWSSVTAVRCFSIYAGLAVFINFVFMITWILSGIVITNEWPNWPLIHWNFSRNADVIYENILNMKSTFDQYLVLFVEKYSTWIVIVFGTISGVSMFTVLCWPKLQVPDSSEFQLFEKKHPFEQYDLIYKDRFRFSHAYSEENFDEKLPLRFVWGVLPIDSGNYLDPMSRGRLHFDSSFDVAAAESQEWLLRFCRRLRLQPFSVTMGPTLSNCFIETFKKWMDRPCIDEFDDTRRFPCCDNVTFPYPRRVFNVCVVQAMTSIYNGESFLQSEVAGPRFTRSSSKKTPKIKALVVEFNSNLSFTTSYETMAAFYNQVETWTKTELSTAPSGLKNGWFVSYLSFFDLQRTLTQDTTISILISMSVALLVLFGATLNVPLSLIAIFTISCIIFVSISILILLGWKLNILESIAISLAIGLSVDFSLHYAVNYRLCPDKANRRSCVVQSLSMMAAPSLMAAITTGASGLFMLPSIVLPYIQIGIFLIVVSSVSWLWASFFQMSLLYRFGPQNNYGQFVPPKLRLKAIGDSIRKQCCLESNGGNDKKSLFRSFFSRYKSNPIYSVHEMQNLEGRKKMADENFESVTIPAIKLKPGQFVLDTEELPSGDSTVTYLQDDECERPGNMYVEM